MCALAIACKGMCATYLLCVLENISVNIVTSITAIIPYQSMAQKKKKALHFHYLCTWISFKKHRSTPDCPIPA